MNLTLTIKNKECNDYDQSFWQKLKEAVTDNTFLPIYLVSSLCASDTGMCSVKSLVSDHPWW